MTAWGSKFGRGPRLPRIVYAPAPRVVAVRRTPSKARVLWDAFKALLAEAWTDYKLKRAVNRLERM